MTVQDFEEWTLLKIYLSREKIDLEISTIPLEESVSFIECIQNKGNLILYKRDNNYECIEGQLTFKMIINHVNSILCSKEMTVEDSDSLFSTVPIYIFPLA